MKRGPRNEDKESRSAQQSSPEWYRATSRQLKLPPAYSLSTASFAPAATSEPSLFSSCQAAGLREFNSRLHLFSYEKAGSSGGQRKFLAATYPSFWNHYVQMGDCRHFYEVITERAPCHLYFDLEYSKEANPDKGEGEEMLCTFVHTLIEFIQRTLRVSCSSAEVLDLDSSTAAKFSHHLIVHIPGWAFASNAHVGRFVHAFARHILSLSTSAPPSSVTALSSSDIAASPLPPSSSGNTHSVNPIEPACLTDIAFPTSSLLNEAPTTSASKTSSYRSLLVKMAEDGRESLFVDLAVYSKNRNFRLFLSRKMGKDATLREAAGSKFDLERWRIAFPYPLPSEERDCALFFASLICNVQEYEYLVGGNGSTGGREDDCVVSGTRPVRLLTFDGIEESSMRHIRATAMGLGGRRGAARPLEMMKGTGGEERENVEAGTQAAEAYAHNSRRIGDPPDSMTLCHPPMCGVGPSPFPHIDEFVIGTLASRGGLRGHIRRCVMTF